MPKAIYKGDREHSADYDDFTVDKEYDILFPPDYDNSGEVVVFDDNDYLTKQPGVDFDFIN